MSRSNIGDSVSRVAGEFEKIVELRGGVELAYVCSECGCIIEDDEVESIEACLNCDQSFYDLD